MNTVTKTNEYPMVQIRKGDAAETELQVVTKPQFEKLLAKWRQHNNGLRLREFVQSAQPTFGCDDAIAVKWCGMWLCIERDGYCHT